MIVTVEKFVLAMGWPPGWLAVRSWKVNET